MFEERLSFLNKEIGFNYLLCFTMRFIVLLKCLDLMIVVLIVYKLSLNTVYLVNIVQVVTGQGIADC